MLTWLSSWLFNPLLAGGTAAVASPILIHLLSRRRYRRVRWAAVEFLLAAYAKNRRRVQMEQLILLAIRCIAVLLLALVFARPFIRPGAAAALLGSAPRTERIVLLDDSYSMAYRLGGKSVFENGVAAVQRLAHWIGSEMPADSLTLVLTSNPRQPVLAVPALSETHLQKLDETLRTLAPSELPARPAEALRAIAESIARQPTQTNTAVYVVSDFQRMDWEAEIETSKRRNVETSKLGAASRKPRTTSTQAVGGSPIAPLADLVRRDRSVRLLLIDVSDAHPQNVAITDVRPLAHQVVAGAPVRIAVDIANYTDADLRDVELSLSLADQALPPVVVPRIAAGQVATEPVEVTFPRAGSDFVRVAVADSAGGGTGGLPLDNTRAWAGTVQEAVRLLIVDGEPSSDNYKDEVYLLKTALRPEGRSFSGNDVRVIEETELDGLDLSPFHAVILANVYRISDTARQALERYVADGGGLAVFAGTQVDLGLYNDTLYAGGKGLLPGSLIEVRSPPPTRTEGAYALGMWDESHPLLRSFAGPAAELLRHIRFNRVIAVSPAGSSALNPLPVRSAATTQDSLRNTPIAASQPVRPGASVIASINDSAASPLILERPFGRGNVVWIGSTADLDWNDWARDPSYVPFALELAAYLARSPATPGWAAVGEPMRCTLDPNQMAPKALLHLPGDSLEAPLSLDARPMQDGGFAVTWDDTKRAGIYRFDLARLGGETVPQYAAVNPDPRESDLAPAGRAGLMRSLPEMKFEYLRDLSILAESSSESRRELWWPLLLVVAGLLMTEHGLAWWFGKGRA